MTLQPQKFDRNAIPISLAAGFSPVLVSGRDGETVSTGFRAGNKPLKRFADLAMKVTGLKPGANETPPSRMADSLRETGFRRDAENSTRDACAPLRLGVRAHDFGRMPVDELAARIAAGGFSCVQLAPNKAIAGLDLRAGDLNADLARQIGGAFARHGVGIEVLGCYINPIHPDLKTCAALLEFFKDHLRFARDFGCGLVALESGSVNADYSPHLANHGEEAFQTMLTSIAELAAVAENFGVNVGLEAVTSHTVSTPKKMRRVLDEIASHNLRVVLDPVNLLSGENFREQSRVVAEALDLFGDRVAVVHAKDFIFENGVMKTVPAGRGLLDYAPVLKFIRSLKSGVSVLLEETEADAAGGCAEFLRRQFNEVNL